MALSLPPLPPASAPRSRFRYLEAAADQTGLLADALHQIYRGRLDVIIIRGVYSRDEMADVVGKLERNEVAFPKTPQESHDTSTKQMVVYGDIITPSDTKPDGPPLDRYLKLAGEYLGAIKELFRGHADFHPRLAQVLTGLAGGRRIDVPIHPSGQSYTPTTIRRLPPDCVIPLHVGNYFLGMPPYQYLSTIIDSSDQLSFFMPLSVPDQGGELSVFDLRFDDPKVPMKSGYVDEAQVISKIPFEMFHPGPGDLLIFDGGRFFHRVERVLGARARWTVGGFLAFAKDEQPTIYFWS